jgi:hypothetical protein
MVARKKQTSSGDNSSVQDQDDSEPLEGSDDKDNGIIIDHSTGINVGPKHATNIRGHPSRGNAKFEVVVAQEYVG